MSAIFIANTDNEQEAMEVAAALIDLAASGGLISAKIDVTDTHRGRVILTRNVIAKETP
jgi:hypothetical protein